MARLRPERVRTDTSPGGAYSGLRSDLLSMTSARRTELGLASTLEAPVWAVLMEFGYPGASVTLFATADGHTSLFFSNGGFFLGGGLHEDVREAVVPLFETANRSFKQMTPVESFPVPEAGHAIFYFLTDCGVLSGGGLKHDLADDRHPLSPLYHAGHGMLTQLRIRAEQSQTVGQSTERRPNKKVCPRCGKDLNIYAVKCRFCKTEL